MRASDKNGNAIDPMLVALTALEWVLRDDRRAQRLLDLTGLSPDIIRESAGDPAMLGAVLGFLESHEPDLIACAQALGHSPETLVNAHRELRI